MSRHWVRWGCLAAIVGVALFMSTPTYNAPQNPNTTSPNDLNQLLGSHGVTLIKQGASIAAVTGAYNTQQSLLNTSVDQPFTMSGTSVTRVEVPTSVLNGAGSNLTISLYTDSGGLPNTLVQSTKVPNDMLTSIVGLTQVGALTQTWAAAPPLNIPSPRSWVPGIGTDGSYALAFGGSGTSGNDLGPLTYTAPVSTITGTDTSQGAVWQLQASVPGLPTSGAATAGATIGQSGIDQSAATIVQSGDQSYAVSVGGFVYAGDTTSNINPTNLVFYGPMTSGQVLQWVSGPTLPVTMGSPPAGIAAVGNNVYVMGGGTTSVYYNTISNGTMAANWSTAPSLPVFLNFAAAAVVQGYLVVSGRSGTDSSKTVVYAARINSDNTINAWVPWPSPTNPLFQRATMPVMNSNTLIMYGWDINAGIMRAASLAVGPSGPANSWTTMTPYTPSTIATPFGILVGSGATPGIGAVHSDGSVATTVAHALNVISVPINATGLTNGATYHVVISQDNTTDPSNNAQVVITESSSGGGTPHYKVGAGSWTTFSGITTPGIPVTVYAGTSGRVVHTWEDSGNRWTWQLWSYSGQLGGYGEATVNSGSGPVVGSFRALSYDTNGVLITNS